MKQIDGQMSLFDFIPETKPETISPAQEYFNETGKRTYWQDSQGKPHHWWRQETIHPVDIRGLCDDAYCPKCGEGLDEYRVLDCERCPYCGTRISWAPWYRQNEKCMTELWGENWADRIRRRVKDGDINRENN